MNGKIKFTGRIALLAITLALLLGVAGRSVGAQPIDIDSGGMLAARALCVGSGGDWELTNGVFFCTYPGGGGWACDMNVSPPTCWTRHDIVISSGITTVANGQAAAKVNVQPSSPSVQPVSAGIAQATIDKAVVVQPAVTPSPTPVLTKTGIIKAAPSTSVNIATAP